MNLNFQGIPSFTDKEEKNAKYISVDAAGGAVSSEQDGVFTLKEYQKTVLEFLLT